MEKMYNVQPKENAPFDMKVFMENFLDFLNLITILTLPFFAFISKLTMWKNKRYNFAEHIIVLSYSYSHYIIFGTIITLFGLFSPTVYMIISFLSFIIMAVYMIYVVQKVFDFTALELIKKVALYALFLFLFFVLIAMIGIIIGVVIGKYFS
jgi:hypothetical protein